MISATHTDGLDQARGRGQSALLTALAAVGRRLSDALGGLLTIWCDGPGVVSGDVDASLLTLAHGLESEDAVLCRLRCR